MIPIAINVADIVEENGKTIRQNNQEKTHDIPIGTLVEVKYDKWHSKGACVKTHARLWVWSHDRDCDGTPLYSLSPNSHDLFEGAKIILPSGFWGDGSKWAVETSIKNSIAKNILNNVENGFSREQLTPIEVTKEVEDGVGSLRWED
jgi:hypothetical protein